MSRLILSIFQYSYFEYFILLLLEFTNTKLYKMNNNLNVYLIRKRVFSFIIYIIMILIFYWNNFSYFNWSFKSTLFRKIQIII